MKLIIEPYIVNQLILPTKSYMDWGIETRKGQTFLEN